MQSKVRGYFPSSAEQRALWSLVCFSASLFPTEFFAAAINLSLSTATDPHKVAYPMLKHLPRSGMDFAYTFSIFPDLCIPFLPSGRYFSLFPSIKWESLSTLLLPSGISLSLPASKSVLNALFHCVYSSFWSLIPFSRLLLINFFIFLSPYRMGLTNSSRTLRRFLLLLTSPKLLNLPGTPPFSTNLFRLATFLALLVGLNFSFLMGAVAWFFKITKVAPFESVDAFSKDPFLALYFSLFLSMIFQLLCLLSSAALFMLTT